MPDPSARKPTASASASAVAASLIAFAASLIAFAPAVRGDAAADDDPGTADEGGTPTTLALNGVADAGASDPPFRWAVEATWMYGPIDGQLQTPTGGEPGTSSVGRPTLEELGLDFASFFLADANVGAGPHEFYFTTQLNRLYGDATLEQTLVSQGRIFPASSRVHSNIKLDLYRLGYRHGIEVGEHDDGGPEFLLYGSAGMAIFAFDYQLDGVGGATVNRAYAKGVPDFGLGVEWPATEQLTVTAEVNSTLDLSKLPLILTAKIEGTYTLIRSGGVTVSGTVGVAYQLIRYDDAHKQPMPNDIEVDFGPVVLLGIDVRF